MIHYEGATAGREEAGEVSTRFAFSAEQQSWRELVLVLTADSIPSPSLCTFCPEHWADILFTSPLGTHSIYIGRGERTNSTIFSNKHCFRKLHILPQSIFGLGCLYPFHTLSLSPTFINHYIRDLRIDIKY